MSLFSKIGKAIIDPGSLVTDQVDKLAEKVGIPTQLSPGHLLHKTLTNGSESLLAKATEKKPDGVEGGGEAAKFTNVDGEGVEAAPRHVHHDKVDHHHHHHHATKAHRHDDDDRKDLADIEAHRHRNEKA
jgi:hypothetical protein